MVINMNVRFIQLVVVDDYHDLDLIIQAFPDLDLSYREIGTTYTNSTYLRYVGVIFEGSSPGPGEVADIILESNIKLEDEE
jgi:hypothetical protein